MIHQNHTTLDKQRLAHKMELNPTPAEKLLYLGLSKNHIAFKKQHIVAGYILDAYLPDYNLAIECDGGYHTTHSQQMYDIVRDQALLKFGITTIRFNNNQILDEPFVNVINLLKHKFNVKRRRKHTKKMKITVDDKIKIIKHTVIDNNKFANMSSSEFLKCKKNNFNGVLW